MTTHKFRAALERPDMRGAWAFIRVPFSVEEHADFVSEAKRPATRERRAARSAQMLTEGRRLKS